MCSFFQGFCSENVLKCPQYLQENLGALEVTLTTEELQEIRDLAEKADPWNGPRFPEWFTAQSFVDTPPL